MNTPTRDPDNSFVYDKTQSITEVFSGGTCQFDTPGILEPYIFNYLHGVIEHSQIQSLASRPVPTGNIVMFVHSGSPVEIYDNHFKLLNSYSQFITGVHTLDHLTYIRTHGRIDNLVITFKPGGFYRIFNCPAFKLTNRVTDLKEIVPADMMQSINSLKDHATIEGKISVLNDFFYGLLRSNNNKNAGDTYPEVLDLIHLSQGNITLQDICEKLGKSARSIQRSFRMCVGVTPREYIRIIRFNFILQSLFEKRFNGWQEVLHSFGYYDQAHFIHDFKSLTGYTPGKFVSFRQHGTIYLDRFQIVRRVSDIEG